MELSTSLVDTVLRLGPKGSGSGTNFGFHNTLVGPTQ